MTISDFLENSKNCTWAYTPTYLYCLHDPCKNLCLELLFYSPYCDSTMKKVKTLTFNKAEVWISLETKHCLN